MARHRKPVPDRRRRWCRAPVQSVVVRVPRKPGIGMVDSRTRMEHLVSFEELLAGRRHGSYEALCGAELLAAGLTDPGRRRCLECARADL
jgi:hypothetical protein